MAPCGFCGCKDKNFFEKWKRLEKKSVFLKTNGSLSFETMSWDTKSCYLWEPSYQVEPVKSATIHCTRVNPRLSAAGRFYWHCCLVPVINRTRMTRVWRVFAGFSKFNLPTWFPEETSGLISISWHSFASKLNEPLQVQTKAYFYGS